MRLLFLLILLFTPFCGGVALFADGNESFETERPARTPAKGENTALVETVKIPGRDYSMGKYEVTQAQYEAVMGENPSRFKGENLPVECVSWYEAMVFCEKLTRIERTAGRLPAGMKYTLPTSEQWEYACRAGTRTNFYTGNSEADLDRAGWHYENSGRKTHPVGEREPNAWGLYDMHGNVWEWCLDERGSNRVNRGGSWYSKAGYCDSFYVDIYDPSDRSNALGFRVALVPAND